MARRSAPIVLLIWLVLLCVAGAIWALLSETSEDDEPSGAEPAAEVETGAAEGAAEDATWTLTGSVFGEHGRYLAGAHVEVGDRRLDTDARGQFEIPGLPRQDVDVVAWREGHTVDTRRVRPGEHAELRVEPLRGIAGVVRLPTGDPVAGMRVTMRAHDDTTRATTSAADGSFAFRRVAPGRYYVFTTPLVCEQGAFMADGERVRPGDAVVDLEMRPGDAFVGRVTAPSGADVEDALVYATMYRNGSRGKGLPTRTGPDGRFALVVPTEQKCSVIVETPTREDGWRWKRWFRHGILPEAGPLDVRLEEGHAIAGRVSSDRGVRVAGRRVSAFRIAGRARNLVTHGFVKPDGTFRIGGLWQADYELRVSGAEPTSDERLLSTPNRAVPSDSLDVELRLHRARPLAGRLLDADGEPCKNAVVLALQSRLRFTATARTDVNGRFEIARVPPGSLRLIARPGGRIGSDVECGTWHGGDTSVDLRLSE